MTVLGQIDPGEAHLAVLRDVSRRWPEFGPALDEPPTEYFSRWREECRMADRIVVNSEWSRDSLEHAQVDISRVSVLPLPFEMESNAPFSRTYPAAFTWQRPLRVLFVGSVATFKGVPSLLGALDYLNDTPVEIRLVGPLAAAIPERFTSDRRVHVSGAVPRSEVMNYYREADVLVFPSHSDGFGMAQVEARAWRLPIIASRSSGRIVQDGIDGVLLPEVSDREIASALRYVLTPGVLEQFSRAAPPTTSSLEKFGEALSELAQ
jgi:glycosyltransferase involved in cell wall biosynthesis